MAVFEPLARAKHPFGRQVSSLIVLFVQVNGVP